MTHALQERALDAEVALKVMGDRQLVPPVDVGHGRMMHWKARGEIMEHPPAYSSDIEAAWRVVEKMASDGWSMVAGVSGISSQRGAKFYRGAKLWGWSIFDGEQTEGYEAVEDSLPLAICKAALNALEAKDDS